MKMQKIYVFDEKDMFAYETVVEKVIGLKDVLLTLNEDLNFGISGSPMKMDLY